MNTREFYIIYTDQVTDNENISYTNGYVYHTGDNIRLVFYSYTGYVFIRIKLRTGNWGSWKKVAYV